MVKSHATGLVSEAPTPAQLAEYFRQIKYLVKGYDIIFPGDITASCDIPYSKDVLTQLKHTMPSAALLRWCKDNEYVVVAGPPTPMNLLDIRSLAPDLFYAQTGGWYAEQPFASNDKVLPQWLAIRKEPVANSAGKGWGEQHKMISTDEYIPNAAEVSWCIAAYYRVRNVRMFERTFVRTSSHDARGRHVYVGNFCSAGLHVSDHWGRRNWNSFGVIPARKCD